MGVLKNKMNLARRFPSVYGSTVLILITTLIEQLSEYKVVGLVQVTNIHKLWYVTPKKHTQLHFLNEMRMISPDVSKNRCPVNHFI